MIFRPSGFAIVLCLCASLVSGCSTLSSLSASSRVLDAYELTPLPVSSGSRSRGVILVDPPTASGALTTDRIAVKPNALQVSYLPDARWVNEAPEHVQLLLVRSLANSGRFSLVSGQSAGPDPDFILLTDLQAFQSEVGPPKQVSIRLTATMLDAFDRRVVASRTFQQTAPTDEKTTAQIIPAFDAAMTRILTDVTNWTIQTAR